MKNKLLLVVLILFTVILSGCSSSGTATNPATSYAGTPVMSPTSNPVATPKPVTTSSPSNPELKFSSNKVRFGDEVILTGQYFEPNIEIHIDAASSGSKTFMELGSIKSDEKGSFRTNLKMDKYANGMTLGFGEVKFIVGSRADHGKTALGSVMLEAVPGRKIDPCLLVTKADAINALTINREVGDARFREEIAAGGAYLTSSCTYVAGTSGTDFVNITLYQANPAAPEKWQSSYRNLWEKELREGLLNFEVVDISGYRSFMGDDAEAFYEGGLLFILKHQTIFSIQIHQAAPATIRKLLDFGINTVSFRIP